MDNGSSQHWDHHWNLASNMFPELQSQWNTAGPATPRLATAYETPQRHQATRAPSHQETQQQQGSLQQQQPRGSSTSEDTGFQSWLNQCGLSEVTIETILRNGFHSKTDMTLMRVSDIDTMRIFPLAEKRKLERLLNDLAAKEHMQPPQPQIPVTSNPDPSESVENRAPATTQDNLSLAALMRMLQQPSSGVSGHQQESNPHGEPGSFPLFVASKNIKHLDIVDYLRVYTIEPEKVLFGKDGEEQVVIRNGNTKPKLENVSPMQWMGASIRIMRALNSQGSLKTSDCDKYLAYMEKISDLASTYTWASVRTYDRRYREWQAQDKCQWGTDNIHLASINLKTLATPQATNNQRGTPAKRPSGPQAGNKASDKCRQYNLDQCTFGSKCKYQHKCLAPGCDANHPVYEHNSGDYKKVTQQQK